MYRRLLILIAMPILGSLAAEAQQLDSILRLVRLNNKTIKVYEAENVAIAHSNRTGLGPENPTIEYDVLFGTPASAGTQHDFALTQRLDFPTAYLHRRKLSKARISRTEFVYQAKIQELLLDVKLDWLKWVHLNQLIISCQSKMSVAEKLFSAYQKRMEAGEGSILELNKLRLSLLKSRSQLMEHIQLRRQLKQDFVRHTGGQPVDVLENTYPVIPVLPNFEILDSLIEANDPMLQAYKEEQVIAAREIKLSRSLSMPALETGYHSQAILGQKYQGVHFGLSIPLWEKKNSVKHKKLEENVVQNQISDHLVEHRQENQLYYQQYHDATKLLQEYESVLRQLHSESLLEKALRFGEISMIQYYEQLYELYEARETALQYSLQQRQALARMLKYML